MDYVSDGYWSTEVLLGCWACEDGDVWQAMKAENAMFSV